MGTYNRALDAHIAELEAFLAQLRAKKRSRDEEGKKRDADDERRNVLTGLIPFVPVGIESLFSGTEGSFDALPSTPRIPGRPGGASIIQVLVGEMAPLVYVNAVGPVSARASAQLAMKNANAIAKRTGIRVDVLRARIAAVLALAKSRSTIL